MLTRKSNERIQWLKENFNGRDPYGKRVETFPRAASSDDGSVARKKKKK
jgi:hypothetical protein